MDLEELIRQGIELRNESERNLENNFLYISWMK